LRRREGLQDLAAVFLSARVLPDDIEAGRRLSGTYYGAVKECGLSGV
jgi:hypothetical protein